MRVLDTIRIENFKSIRNQDLHLSRLNVFIGGNGAGKSNLIQVFRLLREIVEQNLAAYSLARGADSLLHYGRKKSPFITLSLRFSDSDYSNGYEIQLSPTDEGALVVKSEWVEFHNKARFAEPDTDYLSSGTKEAAIGRATSKIPAYVRADLKSYRVYHFHDTSDSAPAKQHADVEDNRVLRPDAGNLPAFLYYLSLQKQDHFRNIEDTVRQIAPFFERFNLEPSRLNPEKIRLEWKEKGSDAYFNASSLSDGTLRFICLCTLLLQPDLPRIVLLDEPELGLHPAAIALLGDLLGSAATKTQVIVATQSVTLVNRLEPEHVWTVDRADGESVFKQLSREDMTHWIDDYALGELWEKNVLGARP